MRVIAAMLMLATLAACGALRPSQGTGAADVLATEGFGAGAQEGSPGNARNIGGPGSTIIGF